MVTGGTKGIGRAIVDRFVGSGEEVFALGRDETALAGLGPRAKGLLCDVTDEARVVELFDELDDVDVLVLNAGTAEAAPLAKTTLSSWQQHFDVNATGAFICTRAVIDSMRRRGTGSIVTVASTAAKVGSRYTCAYSASKHAALGVMRCAAAELAGSGANANAVCPTFVDTGLTSRSVQQIVLATGQSEGQALAGLEGQSLLGRLLDPDEVAASVVWIADPGQKAINGQALVLDGGGLQS